MIRVAEIEEIAPVEGWSGHCQRFLTRIGYALKAAGFGETRFQEMPCFGRGPLVGVPGSVRIVAGRGVYQCAYTIHAMYMLTTEECEFEDEAAGIVEIFEELRRRSLPAPPEAPPVSVTRSSVPVRWSGAVVPDRSEGAVRFHEELMQRLADDIRREQDRLSAQLFEGGSDA